MKRAYVAALLILGSSATVRPAVAQFDAYDRPLAAMKECKKALHANARESKRAMAVLAKIRNTDYVALCRFGRNIGYPVSAQEAVRVRANWGCQQDGTSLVLAPALEKKAEGYRNIVEQDCQKAGM